ncbi:MAG TPA: hypothetical protein EYO33_19760, partial [Phycisphaerales bacterium]|nr:hypothetical protein [Phycisphaerales bacterium]
MPTHLRARVEAKTEPNASSAQPTESLAFSAPFDLDALKEATRSRAVALGKDMAPHRARQVLIKLPPETDFNGQDTRQLFTDFGFASSREFIS